MAGPRAWAMRSAVPPAGTTPSPRRGRAPGQAWSASPVDSCPKPDRGVTLLRAGVLCARHAITSAFPRPSGQAKHDHFARSWRQDAPAAAPLPQPPRLANGYDFPVQFCRQNLIPALSSRISVFDSSCSWYGKLLLYKFLYIETHYLEEKKRYFAFRKAGKSVFFGDVH